MPSHVLHLPASTTLLAPLRAPVCLHKTPSRSASSLMEKKPLNTRSTVLSMKTTGVCASSRQPGQKFGVKVTWLPGFRIRWANALYCTVEKDEERFASQAWLMPGQVQHHQGSLLEAASLEFSNTILKDKVTGKQMRCEWAFEGVEISKTTLHLVLMLLTPHKPKEMKTCHTSMLKIFETLEAFVLQCSERRRSRPSLLAGKQAASG